MPKAIDLIGQRFNRLQVIQLSKQYLGKARAWECRCDCGNVVLVITGNLRAGSVQSCGCLNREQATALADKYRHLVKPKIKHGKSASRIYQTHKGMLGRCRNPKHPKYASYGGRGIQVCERWLKFENFFADMGEPPSGKHSIGRIDNELGYSPENCRWETAQQQQSNMRSNVFLEYAGERLTIREWSRRTGINHRTIHYRLQRGWSVNEVLEIQTVYERRKHHQPKIE